MCNPKNEEIEQVKQNLTGEIEEIKPKRLPSLKKAQIKYYEKNKNKILEYSRNYNKEYGAIKFNCDCGTIISTYAKFTHLKSKKHLKNMEILKAKNEGNYTEDMDKSNCNKRVSCECGGYYLNRNSKTHLNSNKHIKFISIANQIL